MKRKREGGRGEDDNGGGQPDEVAEVSLLLIHGVTGLGSAHPKESLEVRCLGAIRLEACGPILSTRPLDVPLNAPKARPMPAALHGCPSGLVHGNSKKFEKFEKFP